MSIPTQYLIFGDAKCIDDVAQMLASSPKQLRYLLYVRPPEDRYFGFTIRKKNGAERRIFAPSRDLRLLQRRLSDILYDKVPLRPPCHGFAPGKSIVTNASLHAGRRAILNIDLKDFFPTINFGRVRGLFMHPPFGASASVATILAQICCHDGRLPQGAPTSPVVSNLICHRMDGQLLGLAVRHRCLYSRYADDISFSKRSGRIPPELAYADANGNAVVGEVVSDVIADNGFEINHAKVRIQDSTTRQIVTGLVVNSKVNVPRRFVREIRAMIHDWKVNGLKCAEARHLEHFYKHPDRIEGGPPLPRIIEGKLEFLKMVRHSGDEVREKLQRQFASVYPEYQLRIDKEEQEMNSSDFFICHASEDKAGFVEPLVKALEAREARVWYDRCAIAVGDNLFLKINQGLASTRFGVVVLSRSFFRVKKVWPQWELSALFMLEANDERRRVLPIWYGVDEDVIGKHMPLLAPKIALKYSELSIEDIADELVRKLESK